MTLLEDGSLVCGFTTGSIGKRFTNFVVAGSSYPKKKTTIDASNNTKCYEAVDFGFSRASAKSKGGDKSTGIDCIQSFEEDVDFENTLDNKKQKKTEKNNKKKDSNVKRRRQILVAKTADSEVSVVDFSSGFASAKIESTFRVENATSSAPTSTTRRPAPTAPATRRLSARWTAGWRATTRPSRRSRRASRSSTRWRA